MDIETEQNSKKKWIFVAGGVLLLVIIAILAILYFGKNSSIGQQIGAVLPFGQSSDISNNDTTGNNSGNEYSGDGSISGAQERPLFLQLAKGPIAGATAVTNTDDGKTYVRYVLRENGFIYDVNPENGETKQLTNKTIPRIYEASFGNSGNTVILRYLTRDELTRQDVIKTYLADLELPLNSASTTDTLGTLRGDYLPDNISAVSISPDGKNLFYLLPVADGVSGTIISLSGAPSPKEIFRNSFSEWLPQLLNDGKILLTTKPSAQVSGYAYLYDPKTRSLERMLREKNGLTTQSDSIGSLIAYSENLTGNAIFGLYNKKGFSEVEGGDIEHETVVPLTTLPEKCAWGRIHKTLYCGSFSGAGYSGIPDLWYQGVMTFRDTIWSVNTDTAEIALLADPQEILKKDFDIVAPFVDNKEAFLFFTDKNDLSLWSMRLVEKTTEEDIGAQNLTPDELKDAEGSAYQTTTKGN